jgi:hypothetical protein
MPMTVRMRASSILIKLQEFFVARGSSTGGGA